MYRLLTEQGRSMVFEKIFAVFTQQLGAEAYRCAQAASEGARVDLAPGWNTIIAEFYRQLQLHRVALPAQVVQDAAGKASKYYSDTFHYYQGEFANYRALVTATSAAAPVTQVKEAPAELIPATSQHNDEDLEGAPLQNTRDQVPPAEPATDVKTTTSEVSEGESAIGSPEIQERPVIKRPYRVMTEDEQDQYIGEERDKLDFFVIEDGNLSITKHRKLAFDLLSVDRMRFNAIYGWTDLLDAQGNLIEEISKIVGLSKTETTALKAADDRHTEFDGLSRLIQEYEFEVERKRSVSLTRFGQMYERLIPHFCDLTDAGQIHVTPECEVALGPRNGPPPEEVARQIDVELFGGEEYRYFTEKVRAGEVTVTADHDLGFRFLRELRSTAQGPLSDELVSVCELFAESYPGTQLGMDCERYLADNDFMLGEFQRGFHRYRTASIDYETYYHLLPMVEDLRIQPQFLDTWRANWKGATGFAKSFTNEVHETFVELVNFHHDQTGLSVVQELWEFVNGVDQLEDLLKIPGLLQGDSLTRQRLKGAEQERREELKEGAIFSDVFSIGRDVFRGLSAGWETMDWPGGWQPNDWFHGILFARFDRLYRDAENIVRQDIGAPKIGKGFYAELILLHFIRDAFPDEEIIGQGRPDWLKPQSYDIYFSQKSIAIEYQGEQHSRPVEYFGGAETHAMQQERDDRKRELSKKNGITLLEVYPDYDLDQVIERLRIALSGK